MGTVEQVAKRERRWGAFQTALLYAAVGGLMIATGAVPDFRRVVKYYTSAKKGARFNYQAKTALKRLATKGLVVFEEFGDTRVARITDAGRRVLQLESEQAQVGKKRRWDRRWRIVIFDVPERRRSVRVRLRLFMQRYGFVRLQDSVWVYPYDCEELIALAKAEFRIGADVLYMIVESLERDAHLREHFDLLKK